MNRLLLPAPATKQEPPTEGTAPELDTGPTAPGEKGPVERRLDELGAVFGIAFGSFGELSPGLEKLLAEAAKKGGPRVCSDFLVPEGPNRRSVRRNSASLGGGA